VDQVSSTGLKRIAQLVYLMVVMVLLSLLLMHYFLFEAEGEKRGELMIWRE
jgi:hypothetical protein